MAAGAAAPGELIAPAKTIFLPPAGGWSLDRGVLLIPHDEPLPRRLEDVSGLVSYWEVMARPQDFHNEVKP
jgi:hypothetical protein